MPRVTRYWPDLCTDAGMEIYIGDVHNGTTAYKFTMLLGDIHFYYYALEDVCLDVRSRPCMCVYIHS